MFRMLKLLAALLIAVVIGGCESIPPIPVSEFTGRADNACLPEAMLLAENFHRQGINAKILLVTTRTYNHALVAFLYPKTNPSVWVWDSNYWAVKVNAPIDDPVAIAHAWLTAIYLEDSLEMASFLGQ